MGHGRISFLPRSPIPGPNLKMLRLVGLEESSPGPARQYLCLGLGVVIPESPRRRELYRQGQDGPARGMTSSCSLSKRTHPCRSPRMGWCCPTQGTPGQRCPSVPVSHWSRAAPGGGGFPGASTPCKHPGRAAHSSPTELPTDMQALTGAVRCTGSTWHHVVVVN